MNYKNSHGFEIDSSEVVARDASEFLQEFGELVPSDFVGGIQTVS